MSLSVIIMAGGIGKRLHSTRVKVLHQLLGKPIISYVVQTAKELSPDNIVLVYGKTGGEIKSLFSDIKFILQPEPLGTGDAVKKGMEGLNNFSGDVIILSGDVPLLKVETLKKLVDLHISQGNAATILTTEMKKPYGYGRIVRNGERITKIVEEVDATEDIRRIKEINTGIYVFKSQSLRESLAAIQPENEQKEYYLTDVVEILRNKDAKIGGLITDEEECKGINTREDFVEITRILLQRVFEKLYARGITIVMPNATYIETDVEIGKDSIIEPFCVIKGKTRIGTGVNIGAFSYLKNTIIPDNKIIPPYTYIEDGKKEV